MMANCKPAARVRDRSGKPAGLLAALALVAMVSCSPCPSKVEAWREEAPTFFKEYLVVNEEITQAAAKLEPEKRDSDRLYIRSDDPTRLEQQYGVALPKLKQWFAHTDWGGVSYEGNTIWVGYRSCEHGTLSHRAYLWHSADGIRPGFTHNMIAEITDSTSLGNDWYFIITRCDGCGS